MKHARTGALLLVTLASLVWALFGLSPGAIWASLAGVSVTHVVIVAVLVTVAFFLRVLRFQLLLGEVAPAYSRQVTVCGIAYLAINVVPFRLGEFVRSFLLLEDDIPWGRSLGAVAVERVLDLFCLLGMLLLMSFTVDLPDVVRVRGVDVLQLAQRVIGLGLVVLITGLVVVLAGGPRITGLFVRIPSIGPKLGSISRAFRDALTHLANRPQNVLLAMLLAVAVWAVTTLQVHVLLAGFSGMPTGWQVSLAVTTFTVAGIVALPTPGFFGPFEAFCKATLVLWAVEPAAAAAFAILWHLLSFGFHVVSGGLLLVREGLSLTALVRQSQQT